MKIEDLNLLIKYKKLDNGLGYFNERTGEIVINSKGTKAEQDIILIHEFLHAVATNLKQAGVIKKQPDHNFITNCSTSLLVLFYLSGKWKGLKDVDIEPLVKLKNKQ